MIYAFVCDRCGNHADLLLAVKDRNEPVFCTKCAPIPALVGLLDDPPDPAGLEQMRREITTPTVHYKGAGWTRTPTIMKDPIAEGHPQQRHNWGVDTARDMGDPNAISPYKTIVNESTSADGEVE